MTGRPLAAVLLGVLLLVAGGCSGEDEPEGVVIKPGKVGESSRTVDAKDLEEPEQQFNEVDRQFVEMMVPHHHQAVVMAELASKHAQDEEVRAFAQRIGDVQQLEIDAMQGWLETRGLPEAPPRAHRGHGRSMPGMLTDAQLDELADARGADFDRLFVRRMIAHHQGAVAMADEALGGGTDAANRSFAADVAGTQSVEIARLEDILGRI